MEWELPAQLNAQYFRGLKLASLRWVAVSSLPIWLQAHWGIVPGFLTWPAFLAEGGSLALAVAYAILEYRWARRAAQVHAGSSAVMIHIVWTVWDELRTALWYGIAGVSLVPWIYSALDRRLAGSLLSALSATAWTVLLLLAAADTTARLRPFHEPEAPGSLDGAEFTGLGRGGPAG